MAFISDDDRHAFSIAGEGEQCQDLVLLRLAQDFGCCRVLRRFEKFVVHLFGCLDKTDFIRGRALVLCLSILFLNHDLMCNTQAGEVLIGHVFQTLENDLFLSFSIFDCDRLF